MQIPSHQIYVLWPISVVKLVQCLMRSFAYHTNLPASVAYANSVAEKMTNHIKVLTTVLGFQKNHALQSDPSRMNAAMHETALLRKMVKCLVNPIQVATSLLHLICEKLFCIGCFQCSVLGRSQNGCLSSTLGRVHLAFQQSLVVFLRGSSDMIAVAQHVRWQSGGCRQSQALRLCESAIAATPNQCVVGILLASQMTLSRSIVAQRQACSPRALHCLHLIPRQRRGAVGLQVLASLFAIHLQVLLGLALDGLRILKQQIELRGIG
mmetsp:Transcript_38594/g.73946  ORF Transcript_38594/g.73946 Transcript_38594/m.73946 type:complete len:266 (+) Transcript_38594:115-912(+)